MLRINERTFELTEAESVIKEWYDSLLDDGMGLDEAYQHLKFCVPLGGATDKLLTPEFRDFLVNGGATS